MGAKEVIDHSVDFMEKITSGLSEAVDKLGLQYEIDVKELAQAAADTSVKQYTVKDYERIVKTYMYANYRINRKMSMSKAFSLAFPERCVISEDSFKKKNMLDTDKKVGDKISPTAVYNKARYIEDSDLYKKIVAIMSTSLYINFAMERYQVMAKAYQKSMSDNIAPRDQAAFMKIFLEEVRESEKLAKGSNNPLIEVNIDKSSTTTNVAVVQQKLDEISSSLKGIGADKLVELLNKDAIDAEVENDS